MTINDYYYTDGDIVIVLTSGNIAVIRRASAPAPRPRRRGRRRSSIGEDQSVGRAPARSDLAQYR